MHSINQAEPPPANTAGLPTLVDIETVSRALGISMRQVRRFVANGQIPFVRIGHLIRFDSDELNQWIDARRSGLTPPEPESCARRDRPNGISEGMEAR